MPYHVAKSKDCPSSKPYAVIKDDDGKKMGCHESETKAKDQIKALYASESDEARWEQTLEEITDEARKQK